MVNAQIQASKAASTSAPAAAPVSADPFAAFQAEIAGIEGVAVAEEPGTPEEEEFEEDGIKYKWDRSVRKFVPEDMTAQQQYDMAMMTFEADEEQQPSLEEAKAAIAAQFAGEDSPPPPEGKDKSKDDDKAPGEKRAPDDADGNEKDEGKRPKKEDAKEPPKWFDMKVNTSVYLTGLPDDVTVEEISEIFSKCGIIKEEDDESRKPRIKIYRDKATGFAKGDGLVTFLREPSVELAIMLMDGRPFRAGMAKNMTVSAAKFEMKGDRYIAKKRKKKKKVDPGQLVGQEKLLGWGGFDDKLKASEITVILKGMFTPEELVAAPLLADELETDVRAECDRLGKVEKIQVHKYNPEGVVQIRFKTAEAAQQCIAVMKGRFFGGRQLQASMWDGFTKYAIKAPKETPEQEKARLEQYAKDLEAGTK